MLSNTSFSSITLIKKILLFSLIPFFIINANSQENKITKNQSIKNKPLTLDSVTQYYTDIVSLALCDKDQYFAKCFSNSKTCLLKMQNIARDCVDSHRSLIAKNKVINNEIPTAMHVEVGFCMGSRFESQNKDKKLPDPSCYDESQWK